MDRSQRTIPCSRGQFLSPALPFYFNVARKKGLGMIKSSKLSPLVPMVYLDRSIPSKLRWLSSSPGKADADCSHKCNTRTNPTVDVGCDRVHRAPIRPGYFRGKIPAST